MQVSESLCVQVQRAGAGPLTTTAFGSLAWHSWQSLLAFCFALLHLGHVFLMLGIKLLLSNGLLPTLAGSHGDVASLPAW